MNRSASSERLANHDGERLCEALAIALGYDTTLPQTCTQVKGESALETASCYVQNIAGSFSWKISWAIMQGCEPVGSIVFAPHDDTACPSCMIQAMLCPASMQQGDPPLVDTNYGNLAEPRKWGDCYVPQTKAQSRSGTRSTGGVKYRS